jgi:hypothetical protein
MAKAQKGVGDQNQPKLSTREKAKRKADKRKAKELEEVGPPQPGPK